MLEDLGLCQTTNPISGISIAQLSTSSLEQIYAAFQPRTVLDQIIRTGNCNRHELAVTILISAF